MDEFIWDQVIDNCHSKRLRTTLLAERDLKLDRVLDLAAAMEASEKQAAQMTPCVNRVNTVNRSGWRGKPKRQNNIQHKTHERRRTHYSDSTCTTQTALALDVVDKGLQWMFVGVHKTRNVTHVARRGTSARCAVVAKSRQSRNMSLNTLARKK